MTGCEEHGQPWSTQCSSSVFLIKNTLDSLSGFVTARAHARTASSPEMLALFPTPAAVTHLSYRKMEAAKASKVTGQIQTSFYKYLSLHGQRNRAGEGGAILESSPQRQSRKCLKIFLSALRAEIPYISKFLFTDKSHAVF